MLTHLSGDSPPHPKVPPTTVDRPLVLAAHLFDVSERITMSQDQWKIELPHKHINEPSRHLMGIRLAS